MINTKSYRKDHPNPMFFREDYEILNGKWNFCFDYKNIGENQKYFLDFPSSLEIIVPFCYLTKNSGINIQKRCDNVWYQKTININSLTKKHFLHLEGSDYITKIWINGQHVGSDEGAYHRLSFDISSFLIEGNNNITIKCEDDFSIEKPRGKQRFLRKNFLCWYEETTGIYKTVWMERVKEEYIKDFKILPSLKNKEVNFNLNLSKEVDKINIEVSYKNKLVLNEQFEAKSLNEEAKLSFVKDIELWDVLDPKLYDVVVRLVKNDEIVDEVFSYFGFKEISINGNRVFLNNKDLYQKLVLDQGYFDGGDLTPSSESDLINDITNMIEMGFNGCRKHQKREDDRFYYFADALGYLVWAEMPSMYRLTKKSKERFEKEWLLIVSELYNHPSIIVWTPFNESWGVLNIQNNTKTQQFVEHIIQKTKEFDPTRLCISNDGWSQTNTDLITVHIYEQDAQELSELLKKVTENFLIGSVLGAKKVFANGYTYNQQPFLLTEFGGTAYQDNSTKNWGYGKSVLDANDYENRLRSLFNSIKENKNYVGYCYTQVSDVKQEINGLYTMNRIAKIKPSILKKIQD